jgi:hypothetical protein
MDEVVGHGGVRQQEEGGGLRRRRVISFTVSAALNRRDDGLGVANQR